MFLLCPDRPLFEVIVKRHKRDYSEASLYSALGRILYEQGKLAEAIAAYPEAISLNGHFPEVYNNNLGMALSKQGNLKRASVAHRKALSLNPNFISPYANLGNAFGQQGNWKGVHPSLARRLLSTVPCGRHNEA